jgi:hypothetical protein
MAVAIRFFRSLSSIVWFDAYLMNQLFSANCLNKEIDPEIALFGFEISDCIFCIVA